jgi:hypothetical protein
MLVLAPTAPAAGTTLSDTATVTGTTPGAARRVSPCR